MSNTIYSSNFMSDVYGSCEIDEFPSGYIELTCYERGFSHDGTRMASFSFPPSQSGLQEANNLITALQSWSEKIQINLLRENPTLIKNNPEITHEFT